MPWKSAVLMPLLFGVLLLDTQQCPQQDDDDTPLPTPYEADLGYDCDISFPTLPEPPASERSFFALPTSNGFVSATYAISLYGVPVTQADGESGTFDPQHRLITFTDHLMQNPTAMTATRDLLYDFYFGLRVDEASVWLSDVEETHAAYMPGTGIVHLTQSVGDLEIETFLFAPFHGDTYSLVALAQVTNLGTIRHTTDIFSLLNFHAGGEGAANNESVSAASDDGIVETRLSDRLYYRALEAPSHRAAGPSGDPSSNPWLLVSAGQDLSDRFVSGDDVAAGFQWSLGTLEPNATRWGGLVLGFNGNDESEAELLARVNSFVADRTSSDLLKAEQAFWDDFHAVERPPAGLSSDELAVYRQSTAVLKMGQVREPAPAYGQLLASLPPGGWNISWPRDAAYAIVALVKSGHLREAKEALQFMIDGEAGDYAGLLGIDDYLVSACRYYGDGNEESDLAWCEDGSPAGPNVELDDFGLFLWAYDEYLEASGDTTFEGLTRDRVATGVAAPLTLLIDPAFDLLTADSSIWERHWYDCFPNGRKHFTYSSVQGTHGLQRSAERWGEEVYQAASSQLRRGLLGMGGGPVFEESFDGVACPVLASSPEEVCDECGPYDASVVEAINLKVVHPASSLAKGTLRALMDHLAIRDRWPANNSPGFLRNDDGTGSSNPFPWYDDQEWVVMDLRLASAMATMGRALEEPVLTRNAATLLGWVTQQARANADLIAELYSDGDYKAPEDDTDFTNIGQDRGYEYQGSVPMTGFGPGAYILALEAYYQE